MSKKDPPKIPSLHDVQEKSEDLLDDVQDLIQEAEDHSGLFKGLKETAFGVLNSFLGDFKLFYSVLKTLAWWFIVPVSINVLQVQAENEQRAKKGKQPGYFNDFTLMKSLFGLSLAFLVIDDASHEYSVDKYMDQAIFLMFFVALLFVFIGTLWFWKFLMRIKIHNSRVFIGFLVYEYAAIYLVNFVVNGPLGIDSLADDAAEDLIFITYFFPLFHSWYFLLRLMIHYKLSFQKKVIGAITGMTMMSLLLLLPPAVTHTFLIEGATTEQEAEYYEISPEEAENH